MQEQISNENFLVELVNVRDNLQNAKLFCSDAHSNMDNFLKLCKKYDKFKEQFFGNVIDDIAYDIDNIESNFKQIFHIILKIRYMEIELIEILDLGINLNKIKIEGINLKLKEVKGTNNENETNEK